MYVEVVSGLGEALVGNWPGAALSFTAAKPPLAAAGGSEGGPQVTNLNKLQAELDLMRDSLQSATLCCCTCSTSIATCCHACWMTLQVWYLHRGERLGEWM